MKHSEPNKFDIERYFAGELEKNECTVLEQHFKECQVCDSYLQALRREKNEFLTDHPFSSLIGVKAKSSEVPWYSRIIESLMKPALIPVYGLLLIIAVTTPVIINSHYGQLNDDIRFKGNAPLSFIFKRDGEVFDGDLKKKYRENDQIQIRYNSSKEQFVTLLSIDSKGVISFYHSDQSNDICSEKTAAGTDITFPGSITLDNSSGSELFIMLFSEKPLYKARVTGSIWQLYTKYSELSQLRKALAKENIHNTAGLSTLLLEKE